MIEKIYAIEISGICNLSCSYCPYHKGGRKRGLMTWDTLNRTLEWFQFGILQPDSVVHLHLFGEPMMHPSFESIVEKVRSIVPRVSFSINGTNLNYKRAKRLAEIDIAWITVSPHDGTMATSAYYLLRAAGNNVLMHGGPDHSWGGQIDHPVKWQGICEFELEQKAVVRWNGDVAVCCITDNHQGVIGTVWDEDLPEKDIAEIPLCQTCHLKRRRYAGTQEKGEENHHYTRLPHDWIEAMSQGS